MAGSALAMRGLTVNGRPVAAAAERSAGRRPPRDLSRLRGPALDLGFVLGAMLDVFLNPPREAEPYMHVLSGLACVALVLRRRFPFAVTLATVPGFLTGWSELAAMIALGTLARRRLWGWQTAVGAVLVAFCRFMRWPPAEFVQLEWRQHLLNLIYGCIVAGMPVALGLLLAARQELSSRIRELAASREREQQLHAQAVRAEERARLAREMHDLVSHQVTLIAMQAGGLQVAARDEDTRHAARTIRDLSTRTLDELRQLVGVLRTSPAEDGESPGLDRLGDLVRGCDTEVSVRVEVAVEQLPPAVSAAGYRTVQEALTNVRKHAPCASATVLVRAEDGWLLVEVRNTAPHRAPAAPLPSGGHGLMGLRERAALLGGTCQARPTEDGGFLVRVRLPLPGGKG
ncbi:two-component sensor histidine kinase [Gandjariella thermophila]|uniref:histidine kinase n=2 Tax=Gandjariella thermophila TaxID=1931992 RepID=A0A4D4J299_9PSEU|nr:histidine kinase [Gandjariella thermophila]GDY28908.1 two-component sensor histidine kinase [Gandjariella thermophila]